MNVYRNTITTPLLVLGAMRRNEGGRGSGGAAMVDVLKGAGNPYRQVRRGRRRGEERRTRTSSNTGGDR